MGTLLAMKDVGLRIRIDRQLREAFLAACKAEDKPAAQVLREFMRAYVEQSRSIGDRSIKLEGNQGDYKKQ